MKCRAEIAQRPVELRGEQQHRERVAERQAGVEQPEADLDGDDGDADRGQQLERQRRHERHAQRRHRHGAEALAGPRDRVGFGVRPSERPEQRQRLDGVEEPRAQAGERDELPAGARPRCAADEPREERNERTGDGEDEGRQRVDHEDGCEDEQRHRRREPRLGRDLADVRLDRLDAADERVDQLARTFGRCAAGAAPQQRAHQSVTDGDLDVAGGRVRGQLAQPRHAGAGEGEGGEAREQAPQAGDRAAADEDGVDGGAEEDEEGHGEGAGQRPAGD